MSTPPLDELVRFYETLTPASLPHGLRRLYAPQARFRDPFNEVSGIAAIERIFRHMFGTLEAPRFKVTNRIGQGREAMLGWQFEFLLRSRTMRIEGVTHLVFDEFGRVMLHRDYWDAAEELYARLPAVGGFFRWLRRRFAAAH